MQVKTYLLCKWAVQETNAAMPSTPSAPDIAFASDQTNVIVTWTNGATMGSTNEIWKSTDGVNFVLFATVGGAITQKADATGMAAGNIWYYKVRACDGTTCSPFSSVVSASFNYTAPNAASVSFPTLVRAFGFFNATALAALTSISLPALKSCLGTINFSSNPNLTTATLTVLATVGGNLFFGQSNLTGAFSLPALVSTGGDLQIFGMNALTSISCPVLQTVGGNWTCQTCANLTSVSFPALTGVTANFSFSGCTALNSLSINALVNLGNGGTWIMDGCTSMVTISAPALNTCGQITGIGCTALTSFTANSLTIVDGTIDFSNCTVLATFSIPNAFFTADGNIMAATACHLAVASVNQILSRGVASGVSAYDFELAGGTNAAPAGQGAADKATLIGLGNTVNTN